jgi:predicted metal-dependent peptidase
MADLRKALAILIGGAPFEASVLSTMTLTPDESQQTAATDCVKVVLYNPTFMGRLDDATRATVLAHEAWHKATLHNIRRGSRWPNLWNMAADFVINAELMRRGFRFDFPAEDGPPMHIGGLIDVLSGRAPMRSFAYLFDPRVGTDDSAEAIYDRLVAAAPQGGSGSGDVSGGFDAILDSDESAAPQVAADIISAAAAAKTVGNVSAMVERVVQAVAAPKVDWRRVLAHVVLSAHARLTDDRSWARPSRRSQLPTLMPGRRREPAGEFVLVVDTSGSIDDGVLGRFESYIRQLCAQTRPEKIHVVYCDADVNKVETFDRPSDLVLSPCGGGGTDFRPPFDWVRAHVARPSALVYFTDGYGTFPQRAPGYPVVWAFTTEITAPWGRSVRIGD